MLLLVTQQFEQLRLNLPKLGLMFRKLQRLLAIFVTITDTGKIPKFQTEDEYRSNDCCLQRKLKMEEIQVCQRILVD